MGSSFLNNNLTNLGSAIHINCEAIALKSSSEIKGLPAGPAKDSLYRFFIFWKLRRNSFFDRSTGECNPRRFLTSFAALVTFSGKLNGGSIFPVKTSVTFVKPKESIKFG